MGVYGGDSSDILDVAWNLTDARTPERRDQQAAFERMMPATYQVAFPADVLGEWFPHWIRPDAVTAESDRAAYLSMLDAIFVATVLRSERPELLKEYPFVAILPADPTAEESTNQGKGMMTQSIGSAFALGLPLVKALNSSSAPDFRAVAAMIRKHGTVALDEFQIPHHQAHPLNRDNLASLCIGGSIAAGLCYDNDPEGLVLRRSLVANAKWLDLAADLKNRVFPLFLDLLPDSQKERTDVKDMIERGEAGLRLRLAAVALAETVDELPHLRASSTSWRFVVHRALAALFYMRRTGSDAETAAKALDAMAADLIDTLAQHQHAADASGVSATTQSGTNLRVSWPAFWAGADAVSMRNIVGAIGMAGEALHGMRMIPVGDLIRLRLEQAGLPGSVYARILPMTMGSDIKATNVAVSKAFADSTRAFFAAQLATNALQWVPMPGELSAGWESVVAPRAFHATTGGGRALYVAIREKTA